MKQSKLKKLTTLAMLAALAYLVMFFCRIKLIPQADFLTYDPKDVILAITAFIFGPVYGLMTSVIVCLLEMFTVSESGPIGCIMNVVASCGFIVPAGIIYKKKHNMKGAIGGLIVGVICMSGTMLLWNYFITPIYQGVPRQVVASMLLPIFLPFNLLKALINMAVTLMVYKPVVKSLRKSGLLELNANEGIGHSDKRSESAHQKENNDIADSNVGESDENVGDSVKKGKNRHISFIIGLIILISCIVFIAIQRNRAENSNESSASTEDNSEESVSEDDL